MRNGVSSMESISNTATNLLPPWASQRVTELAIEAMNAAVEAVTWGWPAAGLHGPRRVPRRASRPPRTPSAKGPWGPGEPREVSEGAFGEFPGTPNALGYTEVCLA